MFGFLRKPALPRPTMLGLIPVRNPAAKLVRLSAARAQLTAPLAQGWVKRVLGTAAREKTFEVDELGLEVWEACNGRRSLEEVITDFAGGHRLNLREAEVAVTSFLRTLVRRNLVALVSSKPARRRKRR